MIFKKMIGSTQSLIEKIHVHPFNRELAQGILKEEQFIFYLIQDALYLGEFSKALAITAARFYNSEFRHQFLGFSLESIKAEQELHAGYIEKFQRDKKILFATEQSPVCFMYSNYLLKMATLASVEEAVASLLPCFYIYMEVGKNMLANNFPDHPYHDWIALYSSETFELSVQAAINITNELAHNASEMIQDNMIKAFMRSTQLEWLFWDGAYKLDNWPIAIKQKI